jgi:hypothetical protein
MGNPDGDLDPLRLSQARTIGRGSVPYAYRMSATEITAGQLVAWLNAFSGVGNDPVFTQLGNLGIANIGSLAIFENPSGGLNRFSVAQGFENTPCFGMSWRFGAVYCNWLHNGRTSDPQSLLYGAYDVSTFGNNAQNRPTDNLHRLPGARFWIPSLDEWMKAAHFDPHRYGQDQPGWWLYATTSDTAPQSGLPENGGEAAINVSRTTSLTAYAHVTSPWGLMGMEGAQSEWTDGPAEFSDAFRNSLGPRVVGGSYVSASPALFGGTSAHPGSSFGGDYSFRIASWVPSPLSGAALVFAGVLQARRRRS